MKLWIVVNHFLRNDKFRESERKFEAAAKNMKIDCQIVTNAECVGSMHADGISTGVIPDDKNPVLFWDKDIMLARCLEKSGHRVFNSADAIETCDNKILMSVRLAGTGVGMPMTVAAPMTYANIGYNTEYNMQGCSDFVHEAVRRIGFPIIVKEACGSFGAQVYKADNYSELKEILGVIRYPFLFQEFIETSSGRDLRLQVVGDRVVASMYRYSNNDFRANLSNGGSMKPYAADEYQTGLAVKACRILGLDFAGVDILFGPNDKPLICEVNSNAHFKNIDDCTWSDVAGDILKYIMNEMQRR